MALSVHATLYAQDEKVLKKADAYFEAGNFYQARLTYEEALTFKPDNPDTHYKLAICYLELSLKTKALEHAAYAVKYSAVPTKDMYMLLAQTYHLNHQFDKAIEFYKKSDPNNTNKKVISKKIKECEYGKQYVSNATDAKVTNAGNIVNTEYHEYLPYITADRMKLFFTSRRPGSVGGKKAEDNQPYEDIYMCLNKGGAWDTPINVTSLNTETHDACVGLSEDGQTMFVYKGTNGGDLYISELKGKHWTKPEALPFNTPGFESTASLSPDGRTLYFIFKPTTGGSRDIYTCQRTLSGTWSKPKRLDIVNTEYDEDSPYIHPDGKTLYFSSQGHSSMGGYDVFKSTRLPNGTWSSPQNLGYPINTAGDEVYFVLSADGKVGFYSSDKEGGYGKQDIYSIRMPVSETEPQLTLLTGTVKDAATAKPTEAEITVTDNTTREIISKTKSNSEDGSYLIALPCGKNYGIAIEKKGHLFHSENINLDCSQGYKEYKKEIKLVEAKSGSKVVMKNIFFDTGKSDLRPESFEELNRLIKLLKENSSLKIEISGHTDNTGDPKANQILSEQRAASVVNFLIANGIEKSRLISKGYGSSMPIDTNDTPEGRQNNRRTEFKIL